PFPILSSFLNPELAFIGDCSPKNFQALFDRASIRAKVKIRPGRLYSRNKVDKSKRHHVFRRVC
ncbi:MAG: IS4 family transposase, partial [Rickettsiales bacterium]|nr:IS4 family transposase [Rickettsiales bacterium]